MDNQVDLYFTSLRELIHHENSLFLKQFLRLYDPSEPRDKRALHGLVSILTFEGRFDACLEQLLEHEMATMDVNSGLLRGSTLCTRWVTEYLHMHHSFLDHKLRKLVQRIAKKDRDLEIDPCRVENPKHIASRTRHLLTTVGRFVSTIFESEWPTSLRQICYTLLRFLKQHDVSLTPPPLQKGEHVNECFAVSNTLFLHLLCPYLANPPAELLEGTKYTRRTLILVTKMLQALANGAPFDAEWMQGLNEFLDTQRPAYENFCVRLLTPSSSSSPDIEVYSLPLRVNNTSEVNLVNRWKAVYRWMKGCSSPFLDSLPGEKRQEYERLLRQVLEEVETSRRRQSRPMLQLPSSDKGGGSAPLLRQTSPQKSSTSRNRHRSVSLNTRTPMRLYGV